MVLLNLKLCKCVVLLIFCAVLQEQVSPVGASRILMVFPSFSKSHLIIASSVMKGLAEVGHEVSGTVQLDCVPGL